MDAKFLEADPKTAVSAQLIVVVAPSTNGADTKALQTELTSWVSLTRALDASAAGTVVAASADPAPAAKDLTIIGAVRKDKYGRDDGLQRRQCPKPRWGWPVLSCPGATDDGNRWALRVGRRGHGGLRSAAGSN